MPISRALRRAVPPFLNIVYLADVRFPLERANGIQTMETCWALAARGHEVNLVVRDDRQPRQRDPFAYYGLPATPALAIRHIPTAGRPMPASVNRAEYLVAVAIDTFFGAPLDIVLTRDLGVASLLLRLNPHVPLVYESHGYAPDVATALPQLLSTAKPPSREKVNRLARREARVWRDAAGYVTITAGLAEELRRRFGDRGRLAVVPDGVRVIEDHAGLTGILEPETTVVVGYAGHLYPWKGVDVLLQALARVPGIGGVIVGGHEGEPDLGRIRELAATLGLQDRVVFTGQIAHSEIPVRLSATDILVLPNPASAISTLATSPLKLFEYMAAGRAIVASDLPSIREVLIHEVTALLVHPGDAGALACAIQRLAGDRVLRVRLGTAARAAAAEYTWSRRAERLEALFHEVLTARASSSGRP